MPDQYIPMESASQALKTIKGGGYIITSQEPQEVFIPEDFSQEQEMIRQLCHDFLAEAGNDIHDLTKQVALMEKAGALGLLGAHIPEEYGGTLLDTNTNSLIAEELGRGGGSFDTTFAAHIGIGMLPILYFGTEAQRQQYLPGLCNGTLKAAYCLTEPGSGSDALAAKTRADLSADGKSYLFNGQKMWISNAGFADVFIVFAKIDGTQFTGFIVDAHTPGITLGEEEHKLGIKGSSTRQVFFENVQVPVTNLLGEAGKGHLIAFNALNIGRFKLGVMTMGGCKLAIDKSVKYANERIQFGKPISSFGAIQYKLAQQIVLTYALESACYRVSHFMQQKKEALSAQGMSYSEAMLQSAKEYAVECAIIKVAGSEALDYVVDEFLQIHGGYGFSEEYPAARAYRDARINRIYEGTNEINRLLMVDQIIKRAFKGELDLVGPAWAVQKELTQMPDRTEPEGEFGYEQKAITDFKKILLMVAGAAAKYQMDGKHDLNNEQQIVIGIADIAIDTFFAESLCLRVQKLASGNYPKDTSVPKAILKLALHDAQSRIAKWGSDALTSFATGDELTIMLKGVARFSKYPVQNVKELRNSIAKACIDRNAYPL
ncbi:MAG TPA: acyl-CoA dehydrogenase family protein [Saprospiraceae bacterium]|nr:acyl-CoA dehydrogenase family protein [Saprospiraceae bacterium]